MRVDVAVATSNSERTLGKCLESINRFVPVHHLIVVDGNSEDRTRSIATRHNARIVPEPGLLGKVRYIQALSCDTDWIALVDSDVYLYESWWHELSKHTKDRDVGMIVGFTAPHERNDQSNTVYGRYLAYLNRFGAVAFSNALVRRDLILACKDLLNNVHAGEDSVFAQYLRRRNLVVINVTSPVCYHDTAVTRRHTRAYFRWGQSVRVREGILGSFTVARGLATFAQNWIGFTRTSCHFRNLTLIPVLLNLWMWGVAGFVIGL